MSMSTSLTIPATTPLGIRVDDVNMEKAISRICQLARRRDGKPRLVSTLNVDFLVNALGWGTAQPTQSELLATLRRSELVVADGFPILWLSRLVGHPLAQRVCGSDLVPRLAHEATRRGLSLFLMGGSDDAAAAAAQALQQDNPGLLIAGTAAPMICTGGPDALTSMENDQSLVKQINRSGADILLIGLGNPKQELWFSRNRHRLNTPVSIGVGGTFEFIAGTVKRAPKPLQRFNLEWCYRIAQEPRRLWKRYLHGTLFLLQHGGRLLAAKLFEVALPRLWHARAHANIMKATAIVNGQTPIEIICPPTTIDRLVANSLMQMINRTPAKRRLILDLSATRHLTLAGQGELMSLRPDMLSKTKLVGVGPRMTRQLERTRTEDLANHTPMSLLDYLATKAPLHRKIGLVPHLRTADTTLDYLAGHVSVDICEHLVGRLTVRGEQAAQRVVIDFRRVMRIESSALHPLARLERKLRYSGRQLCMSGLTPDRAAWLSDSGVIAEARILSDAQLLQRIAGGQQFEA